ncbi:MAG: ketopantoate reductase family protein [bacterium]|jgi:2-dehydropantoate 2-reductase
MATRIWLYGAGALGSALAALLYGKTKLCLVGSSPHADAVRTAGLRVIRDGAVDTISVPVCRPEEVPDFGENDVILLTGKIRSLPAAAALLRERLSPETVVVALQNGMGFEAELASALACPLERGIVQFGSGSDGRGSVWIYPGQLLLPPGRAAAVLKPLLDGTPVNCQVEEDFRPVMWHKLLINSIANALAGILGTNNQVLAGETLNPVKAEIVHEIKAVAMAAGVALPAGLAEMNRYLGRSENTPSLVRDLQRGLPTEIEWINGAVVRLGKEYGIPTPVNAALVAMVKCLEEQVRKKEG